MVESAQNHLKQARKFLVLVGLGEISFITKGFLGFQPPQESADIHHPPTSPPITEASWWLSFNPFEKNMRKSNWIISLGFRGEHSKNL